MSNHQAKGDVCGWDRFCGHQAGVLWGLPLNGGCLFTTEDKVAKRKGYQHNPLMRNSEKAGWWTQQASHTSQQHSGQLKGLWWLLWAVNEALHSCLGLKKTKQKTGLKLTSTPLLSISAASSYSGFIFLQCPHPKRFKSLIRSRTFTQIANQTVIFWW